MRRLAGWGTEVACKKHLESNLGRRIERDSCSLRLGGEVESKKEWGFRED